MRPPALLHALLLLLTIGCATPEARIKRHAERFGSFPPDVQEDVRKGIIKLGFTTDMVFLAIGRPDYTQKRVDQSGTATVWRYAAYRWRPGNHHWPHRHGRWWHESPYWDDREEYDVLRVEFRDGKVVALEQTER